MQAAVSSYIIGSLCECIILCITLVCSPAFIVELIVLEVDKIKARLTSRLLRCSDKSLRLELETVLQYVRLRPFSYTIMRTVPVNIRLPFTFISLSLTYVIMFMQITHFIV